MASAHEYWYRSQVLVLSWSALAVTASAIAATITAAIATTTVSTATTAAAAFATTTAAGWGLKQGLAAQFDATAIVDVDNLDLDDIADLDDLGDVLDEPVRQFRHVAHAVGSGDEFDEATEVLDRDGRTRNSAVRVRRCPPRAPRRADPHPASRNSPVRAGPLRAGVCCSA